ncbi:hypothetical protein LXL04_016776 [Taraxacum kok-saghyz]
MGEADPRARLEEEAAVLRVEKGVAVLGGRLEKLPSETTGVAGDEERRSVRDNVLDWPVRDKGRPTSGVREKVEMVREKTRMMLRWYRSEFTRRMTNFTGYSNVDAYLAAEMRHLEEAIRK